MASQKDDDEWTGSFKKPWMNPRMSHQVGGGRGKWRFAMMIVVLVVAVALVVLILVNTGVLGRQWAFAVIPFALIAAASSLIMTLFKGLEENRRNQD